MPRPGSSRARLQPIAKRLPTYLRLGWAILREPAVPLRYKTVLYGAIAWNLTPAQWALAPIPIVGQLDGIVFFLVGLRIALSHCPPAVRERHLARLGLAEGQLKEDMRTVGEVARDTASSATARVAGDLRFASRVATGFGRRRLARILPARHTPHLRGAV